MKYKRVLFVFALAICGCHTQNDCHVTNTREDGNGEIIWGSYLINSQAIADSDSLLLTYSYDGILEVTTEASNSGDTNYLEASAENNILTIKTNDAFAHFEEDQRSVDSDQLYFVSTIKIACNGAASNTFTLLQYVTDTNNHPPQFTSDTYTYKMPVPLVPNIDLTGFGDGIIVEDIDYTNKDVTFSVDGSDFNLTTQYLGNKQYKAILKATKFLRLTGDTSITITATDAGTPPLQTTATITITTDPVFTLPDIPAFDQAIYHFTYTEENGAPRIDNGGKDIKIITDVSSDIPVQLDDNTYFEAEYFPDTNTVSITPTRTIELQKESILTLTLTASLSDSEKAETAILVHLPRDHVITVPTFSRPYYTATYSVVDGSDPTVSLGDGQEISLSEKVDGTEITLESDNHFDLQNIDGVWTLSVKSALEPDLLKKGGEITLTLHATIPDDVQDYEGYGIVVVQLPEVLEVPRFDKSYYRATYVVNKDGGTDTVTLEDDLVINPLNEDVYVVTDNPGFELTNDGGTWQVTVTESFDLDDYKGVDEIVVSLTATVVNGDVEPGYGTIVISLPPPAKIPTFEKPYYTANYIIIDDGPTVDVVESIKINAEEGQEVRVNIEISESSDNFELNQVGDHYEVTVTAILDDSVLINDADIVLTLQATVDGVAEYATAALVIQLPKDPAPVVFTQPLYNAAYNSETSSVDLSSEEPIQLKSNYLKGPKVSLQSTDPANLNDYFELSGDAQGVYEITLSKPLDDTALAGHEIVLTLGALLETDPESPETDILLSTSTVVIAIPDPPKTPKFTVATYVAKYEPNEDSATVTFISDNISTDADDPASVIIKPEEKYSSNFEVVYEDDEFKVNVLRLLDDPIVSEIEIYVTLELTVTGGVDINTATLVLQMPEKAENVVPQFSEDYYTADYIHDEISDDTVNIPNTVSIVSDHAADTVVTVKEPYDTNFNAVPENDGWSLNVISKLEDFTDKTIYVVLEATLADSSQKGKTTVILHLPTDDLKPAPKFSQSYYSVEYTDTDTLTNVDSIEITNSVGDTVDVEIEDAYKQHFALQSDGNNKFAISLLTPLEPLTLRDNNDLVITLTAHLEGSVSDATATLYVKLPKKKQISFIGDFYTGTYTNDLQTGAVITTNPEITLDNEVTAFDITSEEHKSNFDIQCADKVCTLTVAEVLTDDDLKSLSEIVLVIEASNPDITDSVGKATVIISLPLQETLKAPEFENVAYTTSYTTDENGEGKIADTQLTIKGVDTVTGIEVTFEENDYSEYFTITPNEDHFDFTLAKSLDPEDIKDKVSILLHLSAKKTDVEAAGKAAVVIELPKNEVSGTDGPQFSQVAYVAKYIDGEVRIDDLIEVIGVDNIADAKVTLDPDTPSDNFELVVNGDHWDVNVKTPLSSDVIEKEVSIFLKLQVTTADSPTPGKAGLVIQLPKKVATASFSFDSNVYMAEYKVVDGESLVSVETLIKILNGNPDTVDVADAYKDIFKATYVQGTVTIDLLQDLPDNTDPVISVDLIASKTVDDTIEYETASLIVKFPSETSQPKTLEFYEIIYTATYTVKSGDGDEVAIDNDGTIAIKGITDVTLVDLVIDDDQHFELVPDTDHWNLNLKSKLDAEVIGNEVSVLLNLKATLKEDQTVGSAGVVIKLPKKISPLSFYFDNNVYMADYEVGAEGPKLTPDGDIIIEGDLEGVQINVPDDYKDVITASINEGKITLELTGTLDSSDAVISIDIIATKPNEEDPEHPEITKTSLIVKVLSELANVPVFSELVYTATYTKNDGENDDVVSVENGPIVIAGVTDASTVNVVSDSEEASHFDLVIDNDHWNLVLTSDLDDDTITDKVSILLSLEGTDDKGAIGHAGIVIKLPKQRAAPSFSFDRVVYMADYEVDDGTPEFSVEKDIILSGDTENVNIELDGEYKDVFDVKLDNSKIVVTLTGDLSDVEDSVISVDIKATKGTETAAASLVIKIPANEGNNNGGGDDDGGGTKNNDDSDDGDKTGLIAAVAVLAVLLVASLVGSAVFYYLKFKRTNNNYNNMEEPPERFTKNTETRGARTTKIEHPTRRATGVIKYPLNDETAGETATEEDLNLEKRKSVQFDTINIDELEIEKAEDTDDNEYDAVEGDDDKEEERRSSRV